MQRRIVVPTYVVNGGFDEEFQSEPREVPNIHIFGDKLTHNDYRRSVDKINLKLKDSRAGMASFICLITGPLMIPLIPFAIITYNNKKNRKKLLKIAIEEFNRSHPKLSMRWRRKPAHQLVIEDAQMSMDNMCIEMDNFQSLADDSSESDNWSLGESDTSTTDLI